ncbi:MAG: hypothetical protein HRF49_07695 [bacterium]|jgi:hypothetical protein
MTPKARFIITIHCEIGDETIAPQTIRAEFNDDKFYAIAETERRLNRFLERMLVGYDGHFNKKETQPDE